MIEKTVHFNDKNINQRKQKRKIIYLGILKRIVRKYLNKKREKK